MLPLELRPLLADNLFHVGRNRPETPAVDLRIMRQAMRDQFKLQLAYRGPAGEETLRVIWPIMLGFVEAKLFVAGWCELREDFRTFRADRIERIKVIEERYPGRRRDLVKRWRTLADEERASASARAGNPRGS
ncbi:helix-turn-helix transcriptional regulator [Sphingobium lactosutens]|uniref:helix-turn-helix transcriptional regulator n=1 Tax=Sphingobium lactosutens TaxID=522773 RepID=UPI001C4C3FB4